MTKAVQNCILLQVTSCGVYYDDFLWRSHLNIDSIDKEVCQMSICPKNKSSKGRRDKRRANWKMVAPNLVKCSKCGELMMPHRVCKACGSYNKKEIIAQD